MSSLIFNFCLFPGNTSLVQTLQIGQQDSFSLFLIVNATYDVTREMVSADVVIKGCDSQSARCPGSTVLFSGLSFSTKSNQNCDSITNMDIPCFGKT